MYTELKTVFTMIYCFLCCLIVHYQQFFHQSRIKFYKVKKKSRPARLFWVQARPLLKAGLSCEIFCERDRRNATRQLLLIRRKIVVRSQPPEAGLTDAHRHRQAEGGPQEAGCWRHPYCALCNTARCETNLNPSFALLFA